MIGWFGSDLIDAAGDVFSDATDALSSAVAAIPGLKDFAGTVVGKVVLTAISGGLYGAAVPTLGPQLAAITFALPGVAKGEGFAQAWTQGFVERVTALIKYFVSVGIPDDMASSQVGSLAQDAFAKLNDYAAQFNLDGLDVHALAKLAGVREDFAALYIAQATGNLAAYADHLFDPATGRMLPDAPTTSDVLKKIADAAAARAALLAKITGAASSSSLAQGAQVQAVVQSYLRSSAAVGVLARAPSAPPSTSVHAPAPAPAASAALVAVAVAAGLGAIYLWYRS